MATIKCFEDINTWKKARELTRSIYKITSKGKFSQDYGVVNQIRRGAISVMSNIAEGYERDGAKEFIHFLTIAKGSAAVIQSQLYIA